jgi:hypothetical protein
LDLEKRVGTAKEASMRFFNDGEEKYLWKMTEQEWARSQRWDERIKARMEEYALFDGATPKSRPELYRIGPPRPVAQCTSTTRRNRFSAVAASTTDSSPSSSVDESRLVDFPSLRRALSLPPAPRNSTWITKERAMDTPFAPLEHTSFLHKSLVRRRCWAQNVEVWYGPEGMEYVREAYNSGIERENDIVVEQEEQSWESRLVETSPYASRSNWSEDEEDDDYFLTLPVFSDDASTLPSSAASHSASFAQTDDIFLFSPPPLVAAAALDILVSPSPPTLSAAASTTTPRWSDIVEEGEDDDDFFSTLPVFDDEQQ